MKNKSQKEYVTLEEGIDFRQAAKLMTAAGFPMNHATARNIFIDSLTHLLKNIGVELDTRLTDAQTQKILKVPEFHETLSEILHEIHHK